MSDTASMVMDGLHERRDGEVEQPHIDERQSVSAGELSAGVVRQSPIYHCHINAADASSQQHRNGMSAMKCSYVSKEFFPDYLYHISGRLKGARNESTTKAPFSNGESAKVTQKQKSPASDIVTHHNNNCDQKRNVNGIHGINGKFCFFGANEFALRPTRGPKKDRSRRSLPGTAAQNFSHAVTLSAVANTTSISSAATNNAQSVQGKEKATACGRKKKGVAHEPSRRGALLRTESAYSVPASKRVVHQTDSIQRNRVQRTFSEHIERKDFSRVIGPNDFLWKCERENRQQLASVGCRVAQRVDIPQVVTQPYDLPAALESAIAERHLEVLMRTPRPEVERIVAKLAPYDFYDVMRYLRHAHGRQDSSGNSFAACQPHSAQTLKKEELLVGRQRQLQNTLSSVAGRTGMSVDAKGGVAHIPKNVRHFMKSFTREACMAFLDECCAACRNCVLDGHLRDGVENGESISEQNMTSLYGSVVTELLFQMLRWKKEESSRVLPPVLQFIRRHLSPRSSA